VITISESLTKDISFVKGVGEARVKLLNKLGIQTIEDILYYFPRNYEDRTKMKKIIELIDGEIVCIKAIVFSRMAVKKIRKGLSIYKLVLRDDTGTITATWYNQKYLSHTFSIGETYVFYGKISIKYGKKEILNPIFEKNNSSGKYTQKIVPVYSLTSSLTQKVFQSIVGNCLALVTGSIKEYLPHWIRKKYNLAEINYSLKNIHFPTSYKSFMEARRRFVFEEFLFLQLGLFSMRNKYQQLQGIKFRPVKELQTFIDRLSFKLTEAQNRVIREIQGDLQKEKPMNRLVQGDVGSGKTIVAALAMYISVKNGYQAALMVPTEILAEQHFKSFSKLFQNENIHICMLTGSISKKQRKILLDGIKQGNIDMIIGTHALIQEGVEFFNLGLVVTDEQHRFGVKQRAILAAKGKNPHILVMTATPIPRTLALILYGDLDISIIDQLPPGRKKVNTYVVDDTIRNRIYEFIRKQVLEGRQIYVVCPLVEESEDMEMTSAVKFANTLKEVVFPNFNVGLLHGKMKPDEKESVMRSFVKGNINILVSTTVIEVGVNVPNATIMVIENAERFGLSQLHQLRGRVGRGEYQSYCILFNTSSSTVAHERMKIMQETSDGFKIAEKDLELRGPGEFFGTRQHGLPDLKIANLFADLDLLKLAQEAAYDLLAQDSNLVEKENEVLKERLLSLFWNRADEMAFN
jgi:ATP-dependent DNA helicase RecG